MPSADAAPSSLVPSRQDLAKRRIGLVLNDKWQLTELLGVGGMAAVYAATHRNGSRVAIKFLPFSLATGPELCERLLREGYLANRITHPAVVRVLDDQIDYEREHAYLVMDLLHGETARQLVERTGTLEPLAAVELMLELADCLKAAHAAQVIHRDIKPENLFITDSGLKVLDFGIARALDGASNLTQTGTSLGTPAYMSPEQARGKQSEITVQSDLYSAGATLYFLLTADTLHKGENPMELMVRAAWTPAPHAATLSPTLPACVAKLIDRCCAFQTTDRYPNSSTLYDALLVAKLELQAAPASATRTLTPTTSYRPAPIIAANGTAETLSVEQIPMGRATGAWLWMLLLAAGAIGAWLSTGRGVVLPSTAEPRSEHSVRETTSLSIPPESAASAAAASIASTQALPSLSASSRFHAALPAPILRAGSEQQPVVNLPDLPRAPAHSAGAAASPVRAIGLKLRPSSSSFPDPALTEPAAALPSHSAPPSANATSSSSAPLPGAAEQDPSKKSLRLQYDGFRKPTPPPAP